MIRRIAVIAFLAAALVIAAAVVAWRAHVGTVAATLAAQTTAAQTLASAGRADGRVLAEALIRPGIHLLVEDRTTQTLYEARANEIVERPLPPGGIPAPPAEEVAGNAASAARRPPPEDRAPPPGEAPRGPAPRSPVTQVAAQLAQIHPKRVEGDGVTIHLTPDAEALGAWLLRDVLATFAIVAAIVITAIWMSVAISRAAHAKLEAIAEERRAAAAEFQRFLADAGHELRTPLTIVSGYVDILSSRADQSDPQVKRLFDGMQAETARMRALVEKMLLLARLETPVSVPRLVDVASVAHDAANSMRAKFAGRDIAVRDGDRASIVIDQDDLYEALHNLIENALKYAPDSDVLVQTGIRDGRAYASVVDHGPGIPRSERDAVFRRFYRGNGRSDSEGSGLGLAIVSRVADRWNGTIDVSSSASETIFTLTFPLADEEPHVFN